MESKNIITSPNNIKGNIFPVRESRMYGGDNVTVPEDVQEGGGFESGAAVSAGLEECNDIILTSNCLKRSCGCEGSREGVGCTPRAEEANSVAGMCVRSVKEDSCVQGSSNWAGTDPVGVTFGEADGVACVVTFKSSIDDKVCSLVSSREGDC